MANISQTGSSVKFSLRSFISLWSLSEDVNSKRQCYFLLLPVTWAWIPRHDWCVGRLTPGDLCFIAPFLPPPLLLIRLLRLSNRCHILIADVFSSLIRAQVSQGKHGSDYSSSGHKHHIDLLSQISWTSITSLSSPFKVRS